MGGAASPVRARRRAGYIASRRWRTMRMRRTRRMHHARFRTKSRAVGVRGCATSERDASETANDVEDARPASARDGNGGHSDTWTRAAPSRWWNAPPRSRSRARERRAWASPRAARTRPRAARPPSLRSSAFGGRRARIGRGGGSGTRGARAAARSGEPRGVLVKTCRIRIGLAQPLRVTATRSPW